MASTVRVCSFSGMVFVLTWTWQLIVHQHSAGCGPARIHVADTLGLLLFWIGRCAQGCICHAGSPPLEDMTKTIEEANLAGAMLVMRWLS